MVIKTDLDKVGNRVDGIEVTKTPPRPNMNRKALSNAQELVGLGPVPKKKGGLLDKMAGLAVSQLVCPSCYISLVLIPCDFTLFKCVPLSSHWYVVD